MIDILQGYIDDFKEFLPKTYESSPITQSVKDKLIEVISKEIKGFIHYDSEGNLLDTSIIVEDNAPFRGFRFTWLQVYLLQVGEIRFCT